MLAKQNTGGNAAEFFQDANAIFRNSQDRQGPRRNPSTPAELGAALVGKVYSEEAFVTGASRKRPCHLAILQVREYFADARVRREDRVRKEIEYESGRAREDRAEEERLVTRTQ
jgi:hypothetical protein